MKPRSLASAPKSATPWHWFLLALLVAGFTTGQVRAAEWHPFDVMNNDTFVWGEKIALLLNVLVAGAGLVYAYGLMREVMAADKGTKRMQEITLAIREGADAYLFRQLRVVFGLIFLITAVLILARWPWGETFDISKEAFQIAIGRGIAFLIGSGFSASVGFVGMRLATAGNLRVAALARTSFGKALQIGYRTGTVTGMLTDALGLLGGTLIFLYYGEKAYEALLGFGFGGTLLALFMRVGGGIYTKAADVGADLVGKIEANIPEDDPRNAATIADNVGDNVGDCAGMAADVFESYQVTIVAAMILGLASFGHKGVIFPLLVQAIGVVSSIISTWSVRAGDKGTVKEAMHAVEKGFVFGSILSVLGFMTLGFFYFRLDSTTLEGITVPDWARLWDKTSFLGDGLDIRPALTCFIGIILAVALNKCTAYWTSTEYDPVKGLAKACRTGHATNVIQGIAVGYESAVWAVLIIVVAIFSSVLVYTGSNPVFVAYGVAMCGIGLLTLTGNTISMDVFGPVADNANGIGEMGYNKDTNNNELAPGDPDYMPPEDYKRARQILSDLDAVGNTTKAITKGIAIGSAVVAAVSLFASFVAVLAVGDETKLKELNFAVFNRSADPKAEKIGKERVEKLEAAIAAGEARLKLLETDERAEAKAIEDEKARIGELKTMVVDVKAKVDTRSIESGEARVKLLEKIVAIEEAEAKAITAEDKARISELKAISEEEKTRISELKRTRFEVGAAHLTVAAPLVFIGLLIGGSVPFLFSSMTIRAVGRAAYLIVQECRAQFRDAAIWAGTKRPDYGRVVDICTTTAQKELIGPGLLALFAPLAVGFLLGPYALGGYLAGMIVVGQLLANFMSNAGGAWDNAKKLIEDQPRTALTGKGSETHKASVTGDTVGDPLKDTAGPAINPLIKVMNMVSLLSLPQVLAFSLLRAEGKPFTGPYDWAIGLAIGLISVLAVSWAWFSSKQESKEMKQMDEEFVLQAAEATKKMEAEGKVGVH